MKWQGVIPAITTPFREDLSVDHPFLEKHAKWMIEEGCTGIVALGSLGEGATLELDEKVADVVKKLKAKGFVSPYLKTFVVARSNPLRFMKEAPELEELIKTIRGKVERFNVDKIKQEDIVASGGGAPDDD